MRTERRIADWQCNRCGHIEQTTVAVLRDEVGNLGGYDDRIEQTASLPNGWTHVEISWDRGTVLSQDLCTTCTEKIDGFMQRRYDVQAPDQEVKSEPAEKPKTSAGRSNSHPPTKRTAKKTTKKAT